MKKQAIFLFLLSFFVTINNLSSQDSAVSDQTDEITELFKQQSDLPIKLSYSNKEMRNKTNDTTWIKTELSYQQEDGSWNTIGVKLRARGNNRRENCYFPPIKIKVKKAVAAGTLFEGNKKLKLVVPCLIQKDINDNVVKEYMAYKLYELCSPYHYKTRMMDLDFTEIKGKKTKTHKLKGFLIEDIDLVADRHKGKRLKRSVHPLQQDNICSVQNDFFQFMIGNTDFSVAYQHNEKLIFVPNKKAMPVPYDFDMSGLVDASYAVVSVVQNETLAITSVTQRMYRGFKRDDAIYQQVRKEYLGNKAKMLEIVNSLKSSFDDPNEFVRARSFITDFFKVLENDTKFDSQILNKARTK